MNSQADFNERFAHLKAVAQDQDITFREAATHIYHWYRWESNRISMNRAYAKMKKHAKKLDETEITLKFRKQLSKF